MSLLRVLLHVTNAVCIQKSFSPPTPVVPPKARALLNRAEWVLRFGGRTVKWHHPFVNAAAWVPALAEACIFLASHGILPTEWSGRGMHILTGSSTPKSIYHTIPWLIVLGTAIDLFGIYIRTSSFKTLGRHFTFQVTLHEDHSLVTDFPYTIVRHPGYMGALMNYIGLAITLAPADGWARAYLWSYLSEQGGVPNIIAKTFIFISVYCYVLVAAMFFERTYAEDRLLHARFGKRWEDWVARVPYKIIPGLF